MYLHQNLNDQEKKEEYSSGTISHGQMRLVPEWWKKKSVEEGRNYSWSEAYHLISWCGHVWMPVELVPFYVLMMWLLTEAVGWIFKHTRLCYLLGFSLMLQSLSDAASHCRRTRMQTIRFFSCACRYRKSCFTPVFRARLISQCPNI